MYACKLSPRVNEQCIFSPTYEEIQQNGGSPNGCGSSSLVANLYFISFTLVVTFIFLNLFIAVILKGFEESSNSEQLKISETDY
mmetsp:Transcript_28676/g.13274  ORF Transcript_28676/g.13274 Transcript_28676/m.13274 type:complete len:84 (+) Transcript_28676:254-505(+)